jgi:ElaB/YqjD/DUF883 family membrane-anchored ribosome-binding protein
MRLANNRKRNRDGVRNGAAELREHAATVGRDVREMAVAAGGIARRQLDPVEEYVREQPLKALLIAACAGAIFGCLFGRR